MSAANERRVITRRSQSEVSIDKEQPIRGEHYLSGEKTVRMKRRESEALTTCHWSEEVSLRLSLSCLDSPASFRDLNKRMIYSSNLMSQ